MATFCPLNTESLGELKSTDVNPRLWVEGKNLSYPGQCGIAAHCTTENVPHKRAFRRTPSFRLASYGSVN